MLFAMAEAQHTAQFHRAFQGPFVSDGQPLRATNPRTADPFYYYFFPEETANNLLTTLPSLRQQCAVAAAFDRRPSRDNKSIHSCPMWVYMVIDDSNPHADHYKIPFAGAIAMTEVLSSGRALALSPTITIVGHRIKNMRAMLQGLTYSQSYPIASLVTIIRASEDEIKHAYNSNDAFLEISREGQSCQTWNLRPVDSDFNLGASAMRVLCYFRGHVQRIVSMVKTVVTLTGRREGYETMKVHKGELEQQLGHLVSIAQGTGCVHSGSLQTGHRLDGSEFKKCKKCGEFC